MPQTLAELVRAKHPGAYDDLSDQALEAAVTKKFPGVYDDLPKTPADFKTEAKPFIDQAWDATKDATGELHSVNPVEIAKGLWGVVSNLAGTVKQAGSAQGALYDKAKSSFESGDYLTAARHAINYLLPLIGPRIDQAGDNFAQGNYAKGVGASVDAALPFVLPQLAGKVSTGARSILTATNNPETRMAIAAGRQAGIPMDAATVTDSPAVANIQKRLEGTLGGSAPMKGVRDAQTTGLRQMGAQLADEANATQGIPGRAHTPASAGESVQNALKTQIQDAHITATTAYEKLRQMEAKAAGRIQAAGGVQAPPGASKPFTTTPLAVDLNAAKTALKPLYDRLAREAQLVPLQGGKARTLTALDRLMNGPDQIPLSVADEALGDLKAMARGADMPELRTGGQATAAQAVKSLDVQVRAAAARGGPDVLKALEDGRAATVKKYQIADVQDLLSGEPGQVFKQITANKDTALNKLRAVQSVAPKELPNVARAYLEDALDQATSEGGFGHADRLFANWQKLGGETKRALFPKPGQAQALDNYFLLAKKLSKNANPPNTANVLMAGAEIAAAAKAGIYAPAVLAGTFFGARGLAKILTTPGGVEALTRGLRLSVNTAPAARSLALAQVVRAAQDAGVPLPAVAGAGTTQQGTR